MLASLNTMVINGIEAIPVKVEVDIQTGLPGFDKVGRKVGMDIKEFRGFFITVLFLLQCYHKKHGHVQ